MAEGYDSDPAEDQANPLDESSFTAFYAEGERLAGTGKPYEDWLRRRDLRSARKRRQAVVLKHYNARKDLEIIAACQYHDALMEELEILSEEYSMLSNATYDSDQISDYGLKALFSDKDQISDSCLKALLSEKSDGFISGLADQPSPVKFNIEVDPQPVTRTDSGEHIIFDVIVNMEDSRPLSPSKSPYYRSRSNIRSERTSMGDDSTQESYGSMERSQPRASGRSFDWDQWNKTYEYPDDKLQYADLPPEDQYFFNTSEHGVLENAVPELERYAGSTSLNRVHYPEELENAMQPYIRQGARAQSPDSLIGPEMFEDIISQGRDSSYEDAMMRRENQLGPEMLMAGLIASIPSEIMSTTQIRSSPRLDSRRHSSSSGSRSGERFGDDGSYVRGVRLPDYVEEMDGTFDISRNQDPLMNVQYLPDFEAPTNQAHSSPRRGSSRQRLYADSSSQMSPPNMSQARFECPLSPIAGRNSHSSLERNRTQNLLNRTYDADMSANVSLPNQNNIFLDNINDNEDGDWVRFEFGDRRGDGMFVREVNYDDVVQEMDGPLDITPPEDPLLMALNRPQLRGLLRRLNRRQG